MASSDFTHVTFAEIPEVVSFHTPLDCRYTVGEGLALTSKDWIGLYKLGWRLAKEYVWFEWSPLPVNQPGARTENHVVFKAECLPRDTDEFYQFCYVAGSGRVCGASPPFQFRDTTGVDFVEFDETPSMLHIQPREHSEAHSEPRGDKSLDDVCQSSGSMQELDAAKQQLRDAELQLNSMKADKQHLEFRLKGFQDAEVDLAKFHQERTKIEESLKENLREKHEEVDSLKRSLAEKIAALESSTIALAESEQRNVESMQLCADFNAAKMDWQRKEEEYKRTILLLQTCGRPEIGAPPVRIDTHVPSPLVTGGDRASTQDVEIPPVFPHNQGVRSGGAAGVTPDGVRTCPFCAVDFPPNIAEAEMLDHIATHEPKLCPICERQFEASYSQASFEAHVNECLVRAGS